MARGGCGCRGAGGGGSGLFWCELFGFLGFGVCGISGIKEGGVDLLEGVEATVEVNSKA